MSGWCSGPFIGLFPPPHAACSLTRAMTSSFLRFGITHNDAPHSIGLLWTSDQPIAETRTCQHTTLTTDRHPRPLLEFEPTISAGERPQTYALDHPATGTGLQRFMLRSDVGYLDIRLLCFSSDTMARG